MAASKQQRSRAGETILSRRAGLGLILKVFEHCLIRWQICVDVLRVDANFAAVAPLGLTGDRLQRIDECPQERRLALTVVSHDGCSVSVFNLQFDAGRHRLTVVTNRQVHAADTRSLARFDQWRADVSGRQIDFDFFERQSIQLLLL